MTKLYISSTYRDLKEHRQVLYHALRKNGYDVIAMEDYVAADERPVSRCLADVRACDLYVGLFGRRFGYVPEGETRSVTELEYQEAVDKRIPRLCFVLAEDAESDPADADDPARAEALRRRIQQETLTASFRGPEDLAVEVLSALHRRREAGPAGVIHVVSPETWVPEWCDAAELRLSITNDSETTLKLAALTLRVVERTPIDDVRLHLAGAPVEEFELRADIRDADEVDLLKELKVQFITPAGQSEAMRLELRCADGFRYRCVLEGAYTDVRNGQPHALQAAEFVVVAPIRSVATLRARKGKRP